MIVITGAAGFIGSCVAKFFMENHTHRVVIVDDFSVEKKQPNLRGLQKLECVERTAFFSWAEDQSIDWVIHLGARTDTTEQDYDIFQKLNVDYSKSIWELCVKKGAGLIYASSAATYGDGSHGYDDHHDIVPQLQPLNPYGLSKNMFDQWALKQEKAPEQWYGLKFFNVYGPNEFHKERMASVVFHAFQQISDSGRMKLFRSHREDYNDGEQLRDFVYVKDVCSVISFLFQSQAVSGLYNLGTGEARTFLDLGSAVFDAMGRERNIQFIDTPTDIREKYQYFTEANMQKLSSAGYQKSFTSLEKGVQDYVQHYLEAGSYY